MKLSKPEWRMSIWEIIEYDRSSKVYYEDTEQE